MKKPQIRSTTVIAVKKDGKVAMAGDGQVTMGNTVMKGNARKVRRMYDGKVLTGFAGATADAFNLFDKFESKIKEYAGDLTRAAVELAKQWLKNSNYTIREISDMLNFCNEKYFSTQFKKSYGISPKQYQLMHNKKITCNVPVDTDHEV